MVRLDRAHGGGDLDGHRDAYRRAAGPTARSSTATSAVYGVSSRCSSASATSSFCSAGSAARASRRDSSAIRWRAHAAATAGRAASRAGSRTGTWKLTSRPAWRPRTVIAPAPGAV